MIIILMMVSFNPKGKNNLDVKALLENVKSMRENSQNAIFIYPDYFEYNLAQ